MDIKIITENIKEEVTGFSERIKKCFSDKRGRDQAIKYITGLLSDVERKNGWQLAEAQGKKTPYSVQQFLYRGNWDPDEMQDCMCEYVKENIGSDEAVMIIDETGFLKKGIKSAGVMRQYSGTAGRVENCQVGVFLTYAAPEGFTLIDRELYLPKEWTDDPERCKEARIPETIKFRTKPQMALSMLESAYEASMPFSWVTADSVYGDYRNLGVWLENIQKSYVLAVSGKAYVWQDFKQHRISRLLKELPNEGWQRISCGTGTKGERYYDWFCMALNSPAVAGWTRCLLVRRSISKPDEVRAFVCFCPESTTTQKLAEIAGTRWKIEQSFEESKGEVGLDHYEVRSYQGWYKHITLACCAHALLTILKSKFQTDDSLHSAFDVDSTGSLSGFKKGRGL